MAAEDTTKRSALWVRRMSGRLLSEIADMAAAGFRNMVSVSDWNGAHEWQARIALEEAEALPLVRGRRLHFYRGTARYVGAVADLASKRNMEAVRLGWPTGILREARVADMAREKARTA